MKLSDVKEYDLGVWIEGCTKHTPTEQNLEIIKIAINTYGWTDYSIEAWQEMYDLYLNEEVTMSDYEDLSWILDDAVEWLNNQLPDGYYFTFEDTDFVLTHEDYEENK